jgi:hypothetical protein
VLFDIILPKAWIVMGLKHFIEPGEYVGKPGIFGKPSLDRQQDGQILEHPID